MPSGDDPMFWDLIEEFMAADPRVSEGTIMGGRCARVDGEFLALAGFKEAGLVVKLPRERVDELIASGEAQPFAPAGRVFREWASVPARDESRWRELLAEGIAFVAPG